jgi:hypothetical protein
MQISQKLNAKYLERFDELIKQGEDLRKTCYQTGGPCRNGFTPIHKWVEFEKFTEWKLKCVTLLENCIPVKSTHIAHIENISKSINKLSDFLSIFAALKAIREDFEKGFLGDLALKVASELAIDYMEQAEQLLDEDGAACYGHVPATVLAGAVLEKSLRILCDKQSPPIPVTDKNGRNLTLYPLINALQKADVFNRTKASILESWANIRNHAAHGEIDKFDKGDVELMIKGVKQFLADYL